MSWGRSSSPTSASACPSLQRSNESTILECIAVYRYHASAIRCNRQCSALTVVEVNICAGVVYRAPLAAAGPPQHGGGKEAPQVWYNPSRRARLSQ